MATPATTIRIDPKYPQNLNLKSKRSNHEVISLFL